MLDYEIYGVAVIPVIIALAAFAKIMGMPTKYTPLLTLVLGIIAAMVYVDPGDWRKGIFEGVLIGLSASGLYSGAKYMSMATSSTQAGKTIKATVPTNVTISADPVTTPGEVSVVTNSDNTQNSI